MYIFASILITAQLLLATKMCLVNCLPVGIRLDQDQPTTVLYLQPRLEGLLYKAIAGALVSLPTTSATTTMPMSKATTPAATTTAKASTKVALATTTATSTAKTTTATTSATTVTTTSKAASTLATAAATVTVKATSSVTATTVSASATTTSATTTSTTTTTANTAATTSKQTLPAISQQTTAKLSTTTTSTFRLSPTTITVTSKQSAIIPSKWFKEPSCYSDTPLRLLPTDFLTNYETSAKMTTEMCQQFCDNKGFSIAGLKGGAMCFCSNCFTSVPVISAKCNMSCHGNVAQSCGGQNDFAIYRSVNRPILQTGLSCGMIEDASSTPLPKLVTTPRPGGSLIAFGGAAKAQSPPASQITTTGSPSTLTSSKQTIPVTTTTATANQTSTATAWNHHGCLNDPPMHLLPTDYATNYMMSAFQSVSLCTAFCSRQGYRIAALQAGKTCYCGNCFTAPPVAATCNTRCMGDSSQTCGGVFSLSVYVTNETIPTTCLQHVKPAS